MNFSFCHKEHKLDHDEVQNQDKVDIITGTKLQNAT